MNLIIDIAIFIGFFTAIAGVVYQWASRKHLKPNVNWPFPEKAFIYKRAAKEDYTEEGLRLLRIADNLMMTGVGIVLCLGLLVSFI